MARPGRVELPTLCLEGRRSFQLSYGRLIDSKRFRALATIHLFPFVSNTFQHSVGQLLPISRQSVRNLRMASQKRACG